jgi:hypothetical protein
MQKAKTQELFINYQRDGKEIAASTIIGKNNPAIFTIARGFNFNSIDASLLQFNLTEHYGS